MEFTRLGQTVAPSATATSGEYPEFQFRVPLLAPSLVSPFAHPPPGFASEESSSAVSASIEPCDSISNVGSSHSSSSSSSLDFPPPVNRIREYAGLEASLLDGLARAMPKHPTGRTATSGTNAIWFNMRGYSRSSDDWPKADQVEKLWTPLSSPAFCPPALPKQVPVDPTFTKTDARAMKRQRTYAAPAHLICDIMDSLTQGAFVPLARAASATEDPLVRDQLAELHGFLSGQLSYQLGLAVRSLAASFNFIASERKTALLKNQSQEVKRALTDLKPGFESFFSGDVEKSLAVASQASQMALTQATLSSLTKLSAANRPSYGGKKQNHGGRYQPYSYKGRNGGSYSQKTETESRNPNKQGDRPSGNNNNKPNARKPYNSNNKGGKGGFTKKPYYKK
jgi:hypothetical protein